MTIELPDRTLTAPDSLQDLAFERWVDVFQGLTGEPVTDKITVLAKLLDVEPSYLEGLPITAFNLIFERLSWVFADAAEIEPSDTVTIGGERLTATPAADFPLRKYIWCEEQAKAGDYLRLLAGILSPNDGYTDAKAEELAGRLRGISAADAIPLINFFAQAAAASRTLTRISLMASDLASAADQFAGKSAR